MKTQGKFSGKGKAILSHTKPTGLGDFLSEQPPAENTETLISVSTDTHKNMDTVYQRLELKLPDALAESLRIYAFQKRTTKTATVIEALQRFFRLEQN